MTFFVEVESVQLPDSIPILTLRKDQFEAMIEKYKLSPIFVVQNKGSLGFITIAGSLIVILYPKFISNQKV